MLETDFSNQCFFLALLCDGGTTKKVQSDPTFIVFTRLESPAALGDSVGTKVRKLRTYAKLENVMSLETGKNVVFSRLELHS